MAGLPGSVVCWDTAVLSGDRAAARAVTDGQQVMRARLHQPGHSSALYNKLLVTKSVIDSGQTQRGLEVLVLLGFGMASGLVYLTVVRA